MVPPFAAALVLASLLAGCSGPELEGEPGPAGPSDDRAAASSPAKPEWAVGDAWTYDVNGEPATYVVTSETALDWIVETDSGERAFADAREDVSRLGPQRKADLAGSQGEDRVEFFRWPLEAGKTWRTRWDQQELTIRVLGVTPASGELEALDPGGSRLYHYQYDGEAGWFSELTHFAPDGAVLVALKLTKVQHNWTGTVVRWALDEIAASSGSDGAFVGGPFEVPAGTTDLWADYHFTCTGAAGWSVIVEPLNAGLAAQQGSNQGGQCTQVDATDVFQAQPEPGTWVWSVSVGGETAEFEYTFLLRTRDDIKFPA
jgi:hypothetical protein